MRPAIGPLRLMVAALLMAQWTTLSGCIAFYSYHLVRVSVRDAETGAPIPGATAGVTYIHVLLLNPPDRHLAQTDGGGAATIRAATYDPQYWYASAPGYLDFEDQDAEGNAAARELRLYRQPIPRVTLILPNGYRGPLKLEARPVQSWVQGSPGQREFRFHASPDGRVSIDATPLLLRFYDLHAPLSDFQAEYENGDPIPWGGHGIAEDAIAVRSVGSSQARLRRLYAIGTQQDKHALHALASRPVNEADHRLAVSEDAINALFDAPPPQPAPATNPRR